MAALLLSLVLTIACQNVQPISEHGSACTDVVHEAGTVCVPEAIARLVTLDGVTFEYAIASGLSPIATAINGLLIHMAEQLAQVRQVGLTGEPNLEEVVALKPDLIVGLDLNLAAYAQVARIAPTVMFPFDHSGLWKADFMRFAEALGRRQAAQEAMSAYNTRLADFRAKLDLYPPFSSESDWHSLKVSVVRIYPDSIGLYLKDSFSGSILQDVGFSRPPSQNIGGREAALLFGNPIQTRVSRELLGLADGDVIFIWTGENTSAASASAEQQLEALQLDPLWRQLRAVRAKHVYHVPSYWIGNGPIAANAILDDLFTHLLESS